MLGLVDSSVIVECMKKRCGTMGHMLVFKATWRGGETMYARQCELFFPTAAVTKGMQKCRKQEQTCKLTRQKKKERGVNNYLKEELVGRDVRLHLGSAPLYLYVLCLHKPVITNIYWPLDY